MGYKLLDIVKLKKERPDLGITTNNEGVIVDVINNGEVYTIEFFDDNDETIEAGLWEYFKPNELIKVE